MATNKDLENKFIHCDIETNLPDNGTLFTDRSVISFDEEGIMPYEEAGADGAFLNFQKVEGIAEWNVSGDTNETLTEKETSIFIRAKLNDKNGEKVTYNSPRMKVRQHRKPNDYKFFDLRVRLANDAYGNGVNDLTIGQKGGRVIVSAYAIVNADEARHLARVDNFNLKISNVYSNVVSQVGASHEVDDVNGKRIEWILEVSRNDNFDGRNAILFCEFVNENTGKKEYKNITIKQEAREHTYTKPVLSLSTTNIGYDNQIVTWEAYYTIDGVKQKVDTFTVNGMSIDSVSEVGITYSSGGFTGRFLIDENWDDEDPDTATEVRSFEIKAVVTGETGTLLGEKLGTDGNKSASVTLWQDNYTPIRYDYKFDVSPYNLPSTALSIASNGIKTWVNHVPYNSDSYYIKVVSTKKKQEDISQWENVTENYLDGVIVSVLSGASYINTHGWSGSDEYKVELKAYSGDVTANSSRVIKLQFVQKDVNNAIIKRFHYTIYQLDKYSQPLFMYDYNSKTEPSHVLLTMGSDLLTGNGFGISAKVTGATNGTISIGNTSTEFGDSANMTLYWGGPNTNESGNQYISFSPKSYSESSKKDIVLSVTGNTQEIGISKGIVSVKAEMMSSKPIAQRSSKHGVNNILLPSGTVSKKILCYNRLNGSSKTKLFDIVRYYQDGSIFIRQAPNSTPKYSLDVNRQNITLSKSLNTQIACEQGVTLSMVDNEIKSTIFTGGTECCALLNKSNNTLSFASNNTVNSFDNIELYYDSTEYRLCGIGIIAAGASSYSSYYNSENLDSFTPSDYNFNNNTCVFVFEPSDELTESNAQYIERSVLFYNISGSNNFPDMGFSGMIYDPVTKKTTTYIINSISSSSQIMKRTIRWKDISNNSTDSSRKLKILSIDGVNDGKIKEGLLTWTFKGFKNSSESDFNNQTHTYAPIETFQYAFNSSTPRLEIGLEDTVANTIHFNVRFVNMNSINGKFMSDSTYKPFTNVNVSYDLYRWTTDYLPSYTFDQPNKVDDCANGGPLRTLYDPINGYYDENNNYQQKFQITNATAYTSSNIASAPSFDIYIQDNDTEMLDKNIIVLRFNIHDIYNYDSPGKKRASIVGYVRLGKIKAQSYMKIDCSAIFNDMVCDSSSSVNERWIYHYEDIGTSAMITVFTVDEL